MVVIELIYKKPISVVEMYLEQHRAYLDKYYEQGIFIASGPQQPRIGGLILANINKEKLNPILEEDPFYQYDVAEFRITEFIPNKLNQKLQEALGLDI